MPLLINTCFLDGYILSARHFHCQMCYYERGSSFQFGSIILTLLKCDSSPSLTYPTAVVVFHSATLANLLVFLNGQAQSIFGMYDN